MRSGPGHGGGAHPTGGAARLSPWRAGDWRRHSPRRLGVDDGRSAAQRLAALDGRLLRNEALPVRGDSHDVVTLADRRRGSRETQGSRQEAIRVVAPERVQLADEPGPGWALPAIRRPWMYRSAESQPSIAIVCSGTWRSLSARAGISSPAGIPQ